MRSLSLLALGAWRPAAATTTSVRVRIAARSVNNKTSTGLAGVPVVSNAREVLLGLYAKTMTDLETIPASAAYRQGVEQITRFRQAVVEAETDCSKIEARIQDGQVEELIEQAQAELELIPVMASWKPWEADTATDAVESNSSSSSSSSSPATSSLK